MAKVLRPQLRDKFAEVCLVIRVVTQVQRREVLQSAFQQRIVVQELVGLRGLGCFAGRPVAQSLGIWR